MRFYIPMQEYFHLTNGQIGNAMSVNSFVTTVGFFLSIHFADKLPRKIHHVILTHCDRITGCLIDDNAGVLGILFVWALFGVTCDMMNWPVLLKVGKSIGQ